ncbi:uncharacterized protein [Cicer arietinum]|uniref:Uncharacterized protein LOC101503743 n=1 Tax=Cicer arietinum TaxID=3827 RepID=A0A1S2Y881_CICAR|nr:uncharacterized protein LOC101503743 [Cicer arietinum]
MDAVLTQNATQQHQSITTIKQTKIKTPNKNKRGNFISNTSENFETYAGILNLPLPTSNSQQHGKYSKQPPLLPLPHVSKILHHKPLIPRSLNTTQSGNFSRKNRTTRDMSLTPKKSKPTKREEAKKRSGTQLTSEFLMDNPWGPDPKHLPVVFMPRVLSGNFDVLSETVFNLSPPPSSLPLPKFSLRSKLSCNAEAAGSVVDAGATNNLRRLLRLR